MGFFSRDKQDDQQLVEDTQTQAVTSVPAPSVDGVLPPGVSPQPAPPTNNLASQAAPVATPAEDTAGEFIMTDQANEWSEQAPAEQPTETVDPEAAPPTEPTIPEGAEDAFTDDTPVQADQPIVIEDTSTPQEEPTPDEEAPSEPSPEQQPEPQPEPSTEETPAAANSLSDIKQQALSSLTPIVDHLDQSPEDRFLTAMMLLQSSEDSEMVRKAYEAAEAITDDKTRAQALLDVVHEINYLSNKEN